MTDKLLQGMAMQAANMVKTELTFKHQCSGVIATYHEGEGLRRMKMLERLIAEKAGPDWINSGHTKDMVWGLLREGAKLMPLDALVFASIVDFFQPTEALAALPIEEQKRISTGPPHPRELPHYFKVREAVSSIAQSPERVCVVTHFIEHRLFIGEPQVYFGDQSSFDGRMKFFDNDQATPRKVRELVKRGPM